MVRGLKRSITNPTLQLNNALLPYHIRQCAAKEMLYGGVRVLNLVAKAPNMTFVRSSQIKVPSPIKERRLMKLDYANTPSRMMPINIGHQTKYDMSILRNKDVYRRFLVHNRANHTASLAMNGASIAPVGLNVGGNNIASSSFAPLASSTTSVVAGEGNPSAMTSLEARKALVSTHSRRMFHVAREHLSVEAATDRVGTKAAAFVAHPKIVTPTIGSEVFGLPSESGSERYMPFQMIKPMHHLFAPAQRMSGLTNPAGRLKQELLDRKGFGWQKKQRTLWNQDIATRGFKPDRFY